MPQELKMDEKIKELKKQLQQEVTKFRSYVDIAMERNVNICEVDGCTQCIDRIVYLKESINILSN